MNGQAQAVVLLLLGGAVLRATWADMHLRYVKPQLEPFLIAAGLLLVVAGAMTLRYELRRDRAASRAAVADEESHREEAGGCDDHDAGHADHPGHHARVGWLLLLPVLGLLLVTPPALGSYAAGQAGTAVAGGRVSDLAPLPAREPVRITLLDYATRGVFDDGASLRGRSVELIGFIALDRDGAPYLARMVMSCCAADGRPVKVALSGNTPAGRPADTWVLVTGRYIDRRAIDPVNEEPVPYLEVETWEQIDPPKQQYE